MPPSVHTHICPLVQPRAPSGATRETGQKGAGALTEIYPFEHCSLARTTYKLAHGVASHSTKIELQLSFPVAQAMTLV